VESDSPEGRDRLEWLDRVDKKVLRVQKDNRETVDRVVRLVQTDSQDPRVLVDRKAMLELVERMDSLEHPETLDRLEVQALSVNKVIHHIMAVVSYVLALC